MSPTVQSGHRVTSGGVEGGVEACRAELRARGVSVIPDFVSAEVIATDYDPSRMQDHLFIIPSFAWLRSEIEKLVRRMGIMVT